jgi:hypothetical protein
MQMAQDELGTEPLEAPHWPIVVWAARCAIYFLAQGGILLLSYAYYGFKTDPHSFAIGFRLDPILAAVHFAWGLAGTIIGFYRPRYATAFVLAFAAFFTVLAALGSFTHRHLGMMLDPNVNVFHWVVALLAWAIGLYALWHKPRTAIS